MLLQSMACPVSFLSFFPSIFFLFSLIRLTASKAAPLRRNATLIGAKAAHYGEMQLKATAKPCLLHLLLHLLSVSSRAKAFLFIHPNFLSSYFPFTLIPFHPIFLFPYLSFPFSLSSVCPFLSFHCSFPFFLLV